MHFAAFSRFRAAITGLAALALFTPLAVAGVTIISPAANSSNPSAVSIAASANEGVSFHLEVWDNGGKLGDVFSSNVNAQYSLSQGTHVTTVMAVSTDGIVLSSSIVVYKVAASSGSGNVNISSPTPGSTSINAVRISASGNSNASHLEVWDNGMKLGDIASTSVDDVYVLPGGSHVMTVEAIASDGSVMSQSSVNYTVAANCSTSSTIQCNLDLNGVDNSQRVCSPPNESAWVANTCGSGVQGAGGSNPVNTGIQIVNQPGVMPNQGNLTLNGQSLHLSEVQGNGGLSNVLFRGQSPTTTSVDSHWTMDEYVYLPDPSAHQAFEMDAQASINGIWTKFYTECAFNMSSGTGYWAVFDSNTGGWIFLNGKNQGGQTPPVVPCNRSQFAQPWTAASDASFTGWHHIAWQFLRNNDGTVTFQTLTFDGTTTNVNFKPNSGTGGGVNNNGQFSSLIQLDGVTNQDGQHNTVDVYLSNISLTHTP